MVQMEKYEMTKCGEEIILIFEQYWR